MWKKSFHNKWTLAIGTGAAIFLAFPNFHFVPVIFLFPMFLNQLTFKCDKPLYAFCWGFLTSFVVMLGGFYWVTYVIHEFGYLPWTVAGILYLCFCGFGALNFPFFVLAATYVHRHYRKSATSLPWLLVGLPALFTVIEFFIPKLFPWAISHALYSTLWAIQIVDITGCSFLTFAVYMTGSAIFAWITLPKHRRWVLLSPLLLWTVLIGYSVLKLEAPAPEGRSLRVALIQANIGSLEKLEAYRGIGQRVRHVVDRYKELTNKVLAEKPDLLMWPETAMPFQLSGSALYPTEIKTAVTEWNVPLLAGAYAPSPLDPLRDYNALYLLEPEANGIIREQTYFKNILLAFGEYLPLGDFFPVLYRYFPQIANFERGTKQEPIILSDGTRLGPSICYEAIIPRFVRDVARHGVHALVNVTNDSWFGPTSEPRLHGAITVFRAIEARLPFFRVTNTGTSFSVDERGHRSRQTGVFEEDFLVSELKLPKDPPLTFYVRHGDWIVWAYVLILCSFLFHFRRHKNATVHR